jgi:protein involved in polysaccharide export with SLBB domain
MNAFADSTRPLPSCRVAACLLTVLVGCQSGSDPTARISPGELHQMETELAATVAPASRPAQYHARHAQRNRAAPGDVITTTFYGLAAESPYQPTSLELRVQDDGNLYFPIVGPVAIAGLDGNGVEKAIREAHVPRVAKDLSIFVQFREKERTTVLVQGAVRSPGLVKLDDTERTPLHAVAAAGGFLREGSGRIEYTPILTGRARHSYDFTKVDDIRAALLSEPLESGDMLVVEETPDSVVYVTGILNRPAAVPVPRGRQISVLRTIAASGGLVDFLDPEEGTLYRKLPDGRQVRVRLDLVAIRSGKADDIALNAGDILDIPHTPLSRFKQWVAENIRIGPFGVTAVYDPVADNRARILADDNNNDSVRRALLDVLGGGVSEVIVPTNP